MLEGFHAMRTPWRFVADLVSRKPKAEGNDEVRAVAPDTIALEYKPAAEEPHSDEEAIVVAQTAEHAEANVEEAKAVLPSDPEPADDDAAETVPSIGQAAPEISGEAPEPTASPPMPVEPVDPPIEAEKAPAKPAPTRAKKIAPVAEPVAPAGKSDVSAPTIPAGPKSVLDEMAKLDADVAELRRQLAKKLTEQNAQLRKMLSRFDAR
jgi:hypothetical protein